MPKPKPRKSWRAHLELPTNPYDKTRLKVIVAAFEESLKRKLQPVERSSLVANVGQAAREFITATYRQSGPKPGEVKAALIDLRDALDNLSQLVEGLDDSTVIALVQQRGEFYEAAFEARGQNLSPRECLIGSLRVVSALSSEANAAIEALDNPGPPSLNDVLELPRMWLGVYPIKYDQSPVTMFIGWLADIFYEISNQEPECHRGALTYAGNFLPFVEACLTPLEYRKRTALGKTIQETLREWREWRKWRDAKAKAAMQAREDEGTE